MSVAAVSSALAFAVFGVAGLVLIATDMRKLRLPTPLVIGLLGAVTVLLGLSAVLRDDFARFLLACACGAGYFTVFLALAALRPGAVGGGDVKLAPTIGLVTGWVHLDAALVLTPLALTGITCVFIWVRAVRGSSHATVIPFGPVLIFAGSLGAIVGGLAALHF